MRLDTAGGQDGMDGQLVGGDGAAACIAAASVLAKVSRDRLMTALDDEHPGYGFAGHKGYSTRAHEAALARSGPCDQHRQSFINVRRVSALAVGHDGSTPTEGRLSR